jgi:PAS domain S-box-containing protein
VLGYALFASLWILLSDRLVNLMFHDPAVILMASSMKGLFFVVITSALLLVTLTRAVRELVRKSEALAESGQRLELAAESGGLGIWDRSIETGAEIWNGRMWEIYGLPPESRPPGFQAWLDHIVHPGDREEVLATVEGALAGRNPYDLEFRVIHPDGRVNHVKSSAQVIRNAEGKAIRVIGINRDRTRKVESEAEQRRLQAELLHAEKLESLGSLAGGVAHDINNVLAAIMGMASALREAGGAGPQASALDTIIRACTRGRDVVKSLLYFARKDMEAMGPLDLNLVADEMVKLLSHTTLSRVQIRTDFQEPLGLIQGDPGALNHALVNLCVNAVDAMPDGGVLELRTRRTGDGRIQIRVKDTGKGMTPEQVRRATEPFYTTKPAGRGTGLGLAMVYGTVQAHRGAMEIRSEAGAGAEVILSFPPLAAPQAGAAEPEPARNPAGPSAPARPRASLRVLLVDDDELVRSAMGSMLEAMGFRVQAAGSGTEALALFRQGLEVDLVLLDMNMPDLNGAQTLVRLLELRPGQAVLMATGYSDAAIGPLLQDRPNVGSLRKPFTPEEFRASLSALRVPGGPPC